MLVRLLDEERDVRELVDALRQAGVSVEAASGRKGDVEIDGRPVRLECKRLASVTPASVHRLDPPQEDVVGVVVADRISDAARRELVARGWGWLDRRGHLRVWTRGLRIAAEFEPLVATHRGERFASVFPPVGIEVALALLKEPRRAWTVKELAASIGRAAGGVSERLRALRDAGLVDRRNRPLVPELFWELVGPWSERSFGLAEFPRTTRANTRSFAGLSWLGLPSDWVLTDTQAALLLGAPLLASREGPPDFYVSSSTVDLAVSHFGPAHSRPAATVKAARYAGVLDGEPFRRAPSGFRIAHPVVVALDLAQDRARGRDVVEAWDPTDLGVVRVW